MGQYYNAVILADNKKKVKAWVYSRDFSNGLKLMEHSYIGNNFVSAFESLSKTILKGLYGVATMPSHA